MATSMERLRDRWDQISPREQRLIVLLAAAFVVVVVVTLGRGIMGGLSTIEDKNTELREVLSLLQDYRASRAALGPESNDVTLPDQPVKLQSYLEDIAESLQITIPGFSPQPGATREGVITESTRIQIRDISVADLAAFLSQVETRSEVVVVETLDIKRGFRDKEKLDVTMRVTTYANEQKADAEGGSEAGEEG